MDIYQVPFLFQSTPQTLFANEDLVVVYYQQEQETERANVSVDTNLITFLLQGTKELFSPQDKIILQPGEGFLLRKGHYLMTEKTGSANRYESLLLFFTDRFTEKVSSNIKLHGGSTGTLPDILKLEAHPLLTTFQQSIQGYFGNEGKIEWENVLTARMQELFALLSQTVEGGHFESFLSSRNNSPAIQLENLMEKHFRDPLSVEQYAFLAGKSLSSFKRTFEEVFHASPRKWIRERRLKEAAYLFKQGELNVSQVCFEVGFENLSHFVQIFKEHYRLTPKQYQQEVISASTS